MAAAIKELLSVAPASGEWAGIDVVSALSALAHQGRLTIFRELAGACPEGLPADEISRRVGIVTNTLTASLTILVHARLVTRRRDGRSIVYSADYDQMTALLGFLVQDSCQGRPEVRTPLSDVLSRAARSSTTSSP